MQIPPEDAPVIPLFLYASSERDMDLELGERSLHWHPAMTTHCVIQHMVSYPPAGLPTNRLALSFTVVYVWGNEDYLDDEWTREIPNDIPDLCCYGYYTYA